MLIQAAKEWGYMLPLSINTPDSPAGQIADRQIVSDFYDEESIKQLASSCDITTYEIEHINVEVLKGWNKGLQNLSFTICLRNNTR